MALVRATVVPPLLLVGSVSYCIVPVPSVFLAVFFFHPIHALPLISPLVRSRTTIESKTQMDHGQVLRQAVWMERKKSVRMD